VHASATHASTACLQPFTVWLQRLIGEWVLRAPESPLRNAFLAAFRLYTWLAYSIMFLPVMRMLLSPFVCNVAVSLVTTQMMQHQVTFMAPIAPSAFDPVAPLPASIAMGRDLRCKGAPYLLSLIIAAVMCLLYIPLILRLLVVRGDFSLLRHSRKLRSAVGWWRDDDQFLALEERYGRQHMLTVKKKWVAVLVYVVFRLVLMGIAEALLPPAAEFFFVLVGFALVQALIVLRPMFYNTLANMALRVANAVLVFVSFVAWFTSIWVRPTGDKGNARDGFITSVIILGIPGVAIGMIAGDRIQLVATKLLLRMREKYCGSKVKAALRPSTPASSAAVVREDADLE
jgi:hypothetical protein